MISLYLIHILETIWNLLFVYLQYQYQLTMKFSKSVKSISLANLVQEISHYCICEGIKNEKIFQYTNQHSVSKIFNPNVTIASTFTEFYRST